MKITASKGSEKIVGRGWNNFLNNVEDTFGYEVDGHNFDQPDECIVLRKNGKRYRGEVTKYSDGEYELLRSNIHEDPEDSVESASAVNDDDTAKINRAFQSVKTWTFNKTSNKPSLEGFDSIGRIFVQLTHNDDGTFHMITFRPGYGYSNYEVSSDDEILNRIPEDEFNSFQESAGYVEASQDLIKSGTQLTTDSYKVTFIFDSEIYATSPLNLDDIGDIIEEAIYQANIGAVRQGSMEIQPAN